jgi:hypothetical protein
MRAELLILINTLGAANAEFMEISRKENFFDIAAQLIQ